MNTNTTLPALPADHIYCGTRTGKKAHIAYPTSSVVLCGHWLKFSASSYKLAPYTVTNDKVICERCATIAAAAVAREGGR